MVEGHVFGHVFDIEPLRLSRIVAGFYLNLSVRNDTHKNDRNRSAPGIATDCAILNLFHILESKRKFRSRGLDEYYLSLM